MTEYINKVPELDIPGLEVFEYIGSGHRAYVYRAYWENRDVVVKRYVPDSERRCQKLCGKSLAQFEYQRNRDFYAIDCLRPYCAEPFACLTSADGEQVFVQERMEGQTLRDYIAESGYLPEKLFDMGKFIVKQAEQHGIHDLDMPAVNIKVVLAEGKPRLALTDFNLIPQHYAPPNPFLYLAYKLGYRKPSHRDWRAVHEWLRLAPLR